MHVAGMDFPLSRPNALAIDGWRKLWAGSHERADEVEKGLAAEVDADFALFDREWPKNLPSGVIHADLFPDNVFFLGEKLSGADRLLFRLQRFLRLRRRHLPQRLVLREGLFVQPDQGQGAACRLSVGAPAERRGEAGAAAAGARLGAALHADPPLRLADHPRRRAGAEARSDRIYPPAALPPRRQVGNRVRPRHDEDSRDFHGWRLLRQSRPRRLGRHPALQRQHQGAVRRRGGHHQQPHGADGGDLGAERAEGALRGSASHRQQICHGRHFRLDPRLEAKRLEDRRQEAGEERRAMAGAGRGQPPAQGQMALGQGSCRPCRERARRRARAHGHGAVQAEEAGRHRHPPVGGGDAGEADRGEWTKAARGPPKLAAPDRASSLPT